MRYPVNQIYISTPFSNSHKGIDLGYFEDKNQPIYAIDNGEVIAIQRQKSGGNVIHIRHDNGYVSEYAHLKDGSIKVKIGTCVFKGEQIANMGNTGCVSGYHLHLGIYKGKYIDYNHKERFVDPVKYLCAYANQAVYEPTQKKYNVKHTHIAHDIPLSEIGRAMYIRYKNTKVVGKIHNGDEVEYYGIWSNKKTLAVVDNIREYTTVAKYL